MRGTWGSSLTAEAADILDRALRAASLKDVNFFCADRFCACARDLAITFETEPVVVSYDGKT